MNPTYTTPKSIALVLVFLFVVTGIAAADEELSGLSGKVVDLEGNAARWLHICHSTCTTTRRFSTTGARIPSLFIQGRN